VFVVYVHTMLSNGSPNHASIMGTSTRWKIAKCDVVNLLVRPLGSIPNESVINFKVQGKEGSLP